VTHSCNPSYSGGRDQEDCNSKPAWANSLQAPILNISNIKKDWGVVEYLPNKDEALSSSPSTTKEKEVMATAWQTHVYYVQAQV
jgi:hypothetical protein